MAELFIRVTEQEKADIVSAADKAGFTISDYVRVALVKVGGIKGSPRYSELPEKDGTPLGKRRKDAPTT